MFGTHEHLRNGVRATIAVLLSAGLILGSAGCGDRTGVAPQQERTAAPTTPAVPELTIHEERREVNARDAAGAEVVFELRSETPRLSGVPERVAAAFDERYESILRDASQRLIDVIADLRAEDLSCQTAEGCVIPAEFESVVAELFEGYATVTSEFSIQLGTTGSDLRVESFTIDLERGSEAALREFVDTSDPGVRSRVNALLASEADSCADGLEASPETAWSPTSAGVVLTWDHRSMARACGPVSILVPTYEATEPSTGENSRDAGRPIPACEQILTIEDARRVIASDAVQFHEQESGTGFLERDTRIGPAAKQAFQGAREVTSCTWFIPNSDGFIYFHIAGLAPEARDALLAEFRASDYAEGAVGASPTFVYDDGARGIPVGPMQFGVVENLLIYTQDPRDSTLPAVIEGLAANAR